MEIFNRLSTPVWVYIVQEKRIWWANHSALKLWEADCLDELCQRDFSTDISDITVSRLNTYLHRFEQGETVSDQWTLYPHHHAVTLDCLCSGIPIENQKLAMLVEARPSREPAVSEGILRGVEAVRYTSVMISLYASDGTLLFHNPAAEQSFSGKKDFTAQFVDPEEGHKIWTQTLAQGIHTAEAEAATTQGNRLLSLQCRVTEDPASGNMAVLINAQDITEIHLARERYRQLFLGNKAVMLLIDPSNGRIIDANRSATRFYGYAAEQLRSMKISAINTLSPEEIQQEMDNARRERRSKFFFKHRLANGEVRDVEVHSGPVQLGDHGLLYSIIHDITEQRLTERALEESEKRHRYVINNTPAGFWLIDTEKRTRQVNDALCKMLGYSATEMIGKHPLDFADDENALIYKQQIALISEVKHRNYEIALRHKAGHNVPVHFSATTMYDENGDYQGSFAFVTDISELKRAEQARRQSETIVQTAFDNAVNGMAMLNTDGSFFRVNPAFCGMLGYEEHELLSLRVSDVTHPGDLESGMPVLQSLLAGEIKTMRQEKRYLRKDGSTVWGSVNAAIISDDQGRPLHTIAQIEDITERRKTAEALEKLSRAVEHSGNSVVITDTYGIIEYVNPHFSQVTGYDAKEAIGKTPSILKSGETQAQVYTEMWQTIRDGSEWRGEILNRKKNGVLFWTLLSISPIKTQQGEVTHYIGVSEDITALKEAHAKAEHLSLYDSLTGLANRRLFIDRLHQAVESSVRDGSYTALLYLDLDRFKNVNDALGHDTGDRLLQAVSKRLLYCVRSQDTVARLGGDEFAVLLPHVDGIQGSRSVAKKIIDNLNRSINIRGFHSTVTTSIGITLSPADSLQAEELMKNADLALYSAKGKGRNNFQFFTEEMNREVSRRLTVEQNLLEALNRDQFELHYQPLVRIKDRKMIGAEALVRWNHPTQGLLYPDSFIQVAEETGLINPLGQWVLETACKHRREMARRGFTIDWLSVNISARQFQHPDFFEHTRNSLQEHCSSSGGLKLELTESALMENTRQAIDTLNRLKALGVGLCIDDFGTGYSSLAYLKQFPVDTLKVDRSFVTDIPNDNSDMEITAAIIAMAHKLGMEVVAEGIETEQQLAFLQLNRCALGQGYLFGRPMPMESLIRLNPSL